MNMCYSFEYYIYTGRILWEQSEPPPSQWNFEFLWFFQILLLCHIVWLPNNCCCLNIFFFPPVNVAQALDEIAAPTRHLQPAR